MNHVFQIGIVATIPRDEVVSDFALRDKYSRAPDLQATNLDERASFDMLVNRTSNVLRVTKGGISESKLIRPGSNWVYFKSDHDSLDSIAWAVDETGERKTIVLQVKSCAI
jgi:hypothetical protein